MKAKLKKELSDWVELPNDPTKEEVREIERFYGYDKTVPLSMEKDYSDLFYGLSTDKNILNSWNFMNRNADMQYVKDSISFWDDIGVTLSEVDVIDPNYAAKMSDGGFVTDEEFLEAIKTLHPSQIPIYLRKEIDGLVFGGNLVCIEISGEGEAVQDTNGVLFRAIELTRLNNKLTSCLYNHEATHTQLALIRGICSKYLNTETLPILIEEIAASRLDSSGAVLKRMRYARLYGLVNSIFNCMSIRELEFASKVEHDKYIQSTLQAISLANIYLNGSLNVQHEMTSDINKMFQGNGTVEQFIGKYDSDISIVSKDPKVLKKLYNFI